MPDLADVPPISAAPIFGALAEHEVRYVVIGGFGAVLHGSPVMTSDIDICPARDQENLERLACALADLDARIRAADSPEGHRAKIDSGFMSKMQMVNLVTAFGYLDLTFEPAAGSGYDDLVDRSVTISIGGVPVPVASLDDIVRSKEAANRPKDQRALPELYALQDEIARREREQR